MPDRSSKLRSHFCPKGVWALGLILPRWNGTLLWQNYFPFLRLGRPGTAGEARASAYPLAFDMVWAEPQPFGPRVADRANQPEASRQNSTSAGWKPLQEKSPNGQEEKTSANRKEGEIGHEANISGTDIKHTALVSTPQFMQSTVFLLTERMQFIPKHQPVSLDLAQSRKASLPQVLGFLFTPAGLEKPGQSTSTGAGATVAPRNPSLKRKDHDSPIEGKNVDGEARSFFEAVPLTRKDDDQLTGVTNSPGESQSLLWSSPSTFAVGVHALIPHLPHSTPLVTLLTKVVEETVEQRVQQLVRRERTVENEQVYRGDIIEERHPSPKLEDETFQRVLSDENVRSLLSRLQQLAAEDRFRMGLGF